MKTAIDPRHQARRLALARIYSIETTNDSNSTDSKKLAKENLNIESYNRTLYEKIYKGVAENREKLIKHIEKNSTGWELSKIFKVDLSILLISTWELYYGKAPKKVVVDESVELAKEFGGEDSQRFINGVLAGIINTIG